VVLSGRMAMHHDQVNIDLATARRLIRANFPQFRSESVRPVRSQGTVNAIFRVGTRAAARFPLRAEDADTVEGMLRREAAAAIEFGECCPVATPRPLGIAPPTRSFPMPWTMQTWVPGEIATPTGLAASEAFADDLVTLLESSRNADTRGRTFDGTGRGGRIADHEPWMQTCFDESGDLLDVRVLSSMWRELRGLATDGPEAMCHGDLIPANVLVAGERMVGVLDAGGFGPADPALDLIAGWNLLDADGRTHMRTRLRCSVEEWLRGAAWAFVQAMGLVWYYRTTNPPMSALGRITLQRLIDDEAIPR
jgi:aminoglycoside phosphotransferase (APT) family kinase protein